MGVKRDEEGGDEAGHGFPWVCVERGEEGWSRGKDAGQHAGCVGSQA